MKYIKNSWCKGMEKNRRFLQVGDLSNKWAILTREWAVLTRKREIVLD